MSSTFPADGRRAGRGWARTPVLTKTGDKMKIRQDERGQVLFELCRHWKKFPVTAQKGQISSVINLERSKAGKPRARCAG